MSICMHGWIDGWMDRCIYTNTCMRYSEQNTARFVIRFFFQCTVYHYLFRIGKVDDCKK